MKIPALWIAAAFAGGILLARQAHIPLGVCAAITLVAILGASLLLWRKRAMTLGVRDLAASKRFYVEGLGWTPVGEQKEIIFFQALGLIFALYLRESLAADSQSDPATFGRAAMSLAYNVRAKDEVDRLIERAARAGGTILKPAQEAFWGGYSGYFADPDGFAWEVAWNPFWPIAADGSVKFVKE